jgi:uncharacterized protein YdhG (YjbR/CyaY superfamily)
VSAATIDEYIASFPEPLRPTLEMLRQAIREAAPEAQEAIKYDMPAFVLHGNLAYFAVNKRHIGFYGSSTSWAPFKDEVGQYKTSRGTIQFPLDGPLPLELIRKIVRVRVQENMARAASRNQELAGRLTGPRRRMV